MKYPKSIITSDMKHCYLCGKGDHIETWKDIKGYEGLYQISNLGRIKSLERKVNDYRGGRIKKEHLLNPTDNGYGYLVIRLGKKGKSYYVHRLVADAFVENPKQEKYVNHLDFDKKNNCADNLEWCSQKENVLYSQDRMCKPRKKYKISNTKEKYITRTRTGRFRLNIKVGSIIFDNSYTSLEEALEKRKEVLSGGLFNYYL